MELTKRPFESHTLEADRGKEKYGRPFNVRLNAIEQAKLNKIKLIFDIQSDGTALKIAAFNYLIVLQRGLDPQYLAWLFKKDRKRMSDYKDTETLIAEEL